MRYNTTIGVFVSENEPNSEEPREAFELNLDFDLIENAAWPTLVYVKNSNIIAWYEVQANVGYKPTEE